MVKLTPGQQADCMDADPSEAFAPAAGKWGQRGATTVLLKAVKADLVRSAFADAWRNVAPKTLVAERRKK